MIPNASHGLRRIFLLQKKHRNDAVEKEHADPRHAVGTENAIAVEGEALVRAAADIGDEELHQIDVRDKQRHEQHETAAKVDVTERDEVAQLVEFAQRHEQRDEHAEAAVNRADAEVGQEDRAMPAGNDRGGEVARNHGAGGDDQQRRDARQHQVAKLVVGPLPRAGAPAEAKHRVDVLEDLVLDPVAHRGQVGNQPDVPEHDRHRQVGRDGEDVPKQRTAEVRPDGVAVRDRREVPRQPDTADVNAGINTGAHDGEDGHRFRGAVDAGGPALAREIKNGGDHRSGVADADPEDEVGDVPRPVGRVVFAPDADAGEDEIKNAEPGQSGDAAGDGRGDEPPHRRRVLDSRGDTVTQPDRVAGVGHVRLADDLLLGLRRARCPRAGRGRSPARGGVILVDGVR